MSSGHRLALPETRYVNLALDTRAEPEENRFVEWRGEQLDTHRQTLMEVHRKCKPWNANHIGNC